MTKFTTFDFPHVCPEGYTYEFLDHNKTMISIWLLHSYPYTYTSEPVKTIWGFYSRKKNEYYAPITSTKPGDVVKIENTRNFTAMQINQTPLEAAFK